MEYKICGWLKIVYKINAFHYWSILILGKGTDGTGYNLNLSLSFKLRKDGPLLASLYHANSYRTVKAARTLISLIRILKATGHYQMKHKEGVPKGGTFRAAFRANHTMCCFVFIFILLTPSCRILCSTFQKRKKAIS